MSNSFVPAPSLEEVRDGSAVLQVGQKGDAVAHAQLYNIMEVHAGSKSQCFDFINDRLLNFFEAWLV